MSLLSICQSVAREIGIEVPTSFVGNNNETASRLLACASRAGKEVFRRHNWVDLTKEHTFTTVISQEDYALPSDYQHLMTETLWDRSNYEEIRGPLSPIEWQEYKSSVLSSANSTWKRFRIRRVSGSRQFSVFPLPESADDLVFEYKSKFWCESVGGDGQADWQADTDVGVVDEYLIELGTLWRMLDRLGLDYAEQKIDFYREMDKAVANDGGMKVLGMALDSTLRLIGPGNVRDTGFGQ